MIILLVIVIIAVVAAVVIFMLSNKTEKKSENLITTDGKEYDQPTEEETKRANELANKLKNQIPTINGGVDTIPLEGAIYAKLLGTSELNAEMKISHTTEAEAFKDLLAGRCEVIFSSALIEEQEKEAAAKNIPLKVEPIVRQALVFTVNLSNPVTSLTQEQIRGIYSGKITNWQELGGEDAEIIVYQNAENSEAQKFMEQFMGEEELIEAKKEAVPGIENGLKEVVATYNNEENAIGFTIYQYPENIIQLNDMKYIKVDEIDVTKEKMIFEEYPLLDYKYAIYNTSKESTTYADELTQWLTTYDGQVAIGNAGYIPIKHVKTDELKLDKQNALGSNEETREENLSDFYYTVKPQEYGEVGQDAMIVGIRGLKDEELEKKINQFIRESIEEMQSKNREYEEYIKTLPSGYTKNKVTLQTECKNGYLNIQVLLTYRAPNGNVHVYDGCSTVYDLYTGEELSLDELYNKETEIENLQIIDKQMKSIILANLAENTGYIELKRPFEGYLNAGYVYGLDTITFTNNNMYFAKGVTFKLDTYFKNISIIDKARDMEEIWQDGINVQKVLIKHGGNGNQTQKGNVQIKEIQNCVYHIFLFDGKDEESSNRINEIIMAHVDNAKIAELIQQAYSRDPQTKFILNEKNQYQVTIDYEVLGNKYVTIFITVNPEADKVNLGSLIIDLGTGNVASQTDVQNWKNENGVQ